MEEARLEAEARRISRLRCATEKQMEGTVQALARQLDELGVLDSQQRTALRDAGRNIGHDHSLRTLLPRWIAHRLGGFNSVTGIQGAHPTGKDVPCTSVILWQSRM